MKNTNGKEHSAVAAHAKVLKIRTAVEAQVVDQREAIWAMMTALVAGEHCCLISPPGTAKSMLAESIASCIDGRYQRRLLNKAMAPTDLFGGMDLKLFQKSGIKRTVLEGGIGDAEIIFLDEIWKSNGVCANSLLTGLNEREYHEQGHVTKLPLRTAFAASNELPDEDGLEAIWDRFLFRDVMTYIESDAVLLDLIMDLASKTTASRKFVPPCKLSLAEMDEILAAVEAVKIRRPMGAQLIKFRNAIRTSGGITISDRRIIQTATKALKAAAWIDGNSEVTIDDFQILRFVFWTTPEEREIVLAAVAKLERSEAMLTCEAIDALIRQRDKLPTDPIQRDEANELLCQDMVQTAREQNARIKNGEFGRVGGEKVSRRLDEMGSVYKKLKEEWIGRRAMG
jgi:MoxR-like ATPase